MRYAATPETGRKLITLAVVTAIAAWQAWILLPEHQRALIRMRAAMTAKRRAAQLAAFAGRQGISCEHAAGTEHAGRPWYQVARLALGTVAARAQRAYERARDAG